MLQGEWIAENGNGAVGEPDLEPDARPREMPSRQGHDVGDKRREVERGGPSVRGVREAAEPFHGFRPFPDLGGDVPGKLGQLFTIQKSSIAGGRDQVGQQTGVLAHDRKDVSDFMADVGTDPAEEGQLLFVTASGGEFTHGFSSFSRVVEFLIFSTSSSISIGFIRYSVAPSRIPRSASAAEP